MAEWHSTPPAAAPEPSFDFGKASKAVGAFVSLSLLIGIGLWGYKLILRDVSGVPVVRAAEGPIRIQPQDPGGQQAQHQGLSVNAIAAVGEASRPADRLVLAPEPLTLSLEDAPVPTGAAPSEEAPIDATSSAEADDALPEDAGTAQLASLSTADVREADVSATPETSEARALQAEQTEGLSRSLRPRLRPTQLASLGEAVAQQVAAARPVDPDLLPKGTDMAQLGAFASEAIASDEWIRLSARFSSYLDGKQRVIQRAESGGRIFFRLRALGFKDLADARRFCSALVAEGAECIPVVNR